MDKLKQQILWSLDADDETVLMLGRTDTGIESDIWQNSNLGGDLVCLPFIRAALAALIREKLVRSYKVCGGPLSCYKLNK